MPSPAYSHCVQGSNQLTVNSMCLADNLDLSAPHCANWWEAYRAEGLWPGLDVSRCPLMCPSVSCQAGLSMGARILEIDQGKKRWDPICNTWLRLLFSTRQLLPLPHFFSSWFLWDLINCCIIKLTHFKAEFPNLNLYIAILYCIFSCHWICNVSPLLERILKATVNIQSHNFVGLFFPLDKNWKAKWLIHEKAVYLN